MSKTKRDEFDKEVKIKKIEKGKHRIDKHRNLFYNMALSQNKETDDAFDEFYDYAFSNSKIKKR